MSGNISEEALKEVATHQELINSDEMLQVSRQSSIEEFWKITISRYSRLMKKGAVLNNLERDLVEAIRNRDGEIFGELEFQIECNEELLQRERYLEELELRCCG